MKKWIFLLFGTVTLLANDEERPKGKLHHDTRNQEVITPSAGPRVVKGVDIGLIADFLYWCARQEGLAIARSGIGEHNGNVAASLSAPGQGQTYRIPRKWDPGFRVGIDFQLFQDGWDTKLLYTWYHAKGVLNLSTDNDHSNLDSISTGLFFKEYNSKWKFRFNNFDLELGRNYYISNYLSLRNHVGLKGGWYDQDWTIFQNTETVSSGLPRFGSYNITNKQDFWWIGLRAGLDTMWHLGKSWAIVGNFALSGVWGRFDVLRRDNTQIRDNPGDPFSDLIMMNTTNNFHTIKPVLEMLLGLQVDWWVSRDKLHLSVLAAWENQTWFNQNNYISNGIQGTGRGDLIMQGFTLRGRFDF